jgi:hypothetical protein
MPLTNGSGSGFRSGLGSCYLHHWPSRRQQKTNLEKKSFSAYYFLKVHLHHFKSKKSKRSHKTEEIKSFRTIFA